MSLPFSGFSDIILRFAADRVIIPSFLLYTSSSSSVVLGGEDDLGEDILLSSLDSTLLTSLSWLYRCDMVAFQISISLDTAFHSFSRASNYISLSNTVIKKPYLNPGGYYQIKTVPLIKYLSYVLASYYIVHINITTCIGILAREYSNHHSVMYHYGMKKQLIWTDKK